MTKLCVWLGLVDVLLVRRPRKVRCVQPLNGFPQCVSLLHTTNVKLLEIPLEFLGIAQEKHEPQYSDAGNLTPGFPNV